MKTTILPLAIGLAAWFLLAAMVGVTFESSAPRHTVVVKKQAPAPKSIVTPQLVMNE